MLFATFQILTFFILHSGCFWEFNILLIGVGSKGLQVVLLKFLVCLFAMFWFRFILMSSMHSEKWFMYKFIFDFDHASIYDQILLILNHSPVLSKWIEIWNCGFCWLFSSSFHIYIYIYLFSSISGPHLNKLHSRPSRFVLYFGIKNWKSWEKWHSFLYYKDVLRALIKDVSESLDDANAVMRGLSVPSWVLDRCFLRYVWLHQKV